MDAIDLSRNNLLLFVGKSHSGKSFLVKHLLTELLSRKVFDFGICFCQTAELSNDYDFLPEDSIVEGYDEKKLIKYLASLKKYAKEKGHLPKTFLIMDDILGDLRNSKVCKKFMSSFRHYNITLFICTQFANYVSTLTREQINHAFIFRVKSEQGREAIYKAIGGNCETEDKFYEILDDATKEKYRCLLYSADIDDENEFRSYKAKQIPQIKFAFH